MADLRTLKTVGNDVSLRGSVTLQCVAVKGDMPAQDALQDASCFLDGVIDMLGDMAIESSDKKMTSALYSIIASASIAKALLDSVVSAIYQADAEQSAEVRHD